MGNCANGTFRRLSKLVHETWTFKDGAPEPNAFAQTSDGYLWVGSAAGLFRFDGVRFELSTRHSAIPFGRQTYPHCLLPTTVYGSDTFSEASAS